MFDVGKPSADADRLAEILSLPAICGAKGKGGRDIEPNTFVALAKRTQYPFCNPIIYPIILKLLHVYETRNYTNMKNLLIYPYNNPSRNYVRYKN